MKDKLTPKVVATLAAVAVAVVALIGWFGLVSPQRSKAAELDQQVAEAQTQLVVAKAAAGSGSKQAGAPTRVLTRAMPESVAMPAVLRQLLRAATRSDVRLDAVTPQAPTTLAGYDAVPMDVVVTGRYFAIQRFLHQLRTQTRTAGNRVLASGRLFSVDTLNLAPGEAQLPQLTATVHMNAFRYSGSPVAATPVATPEAATDTSTSSTADAAGETP